MKHYSTSSIHVRVPGILVSKFKTAIGFLEMSAVIKNYMQEYIRDYEKQYGVIQICPDKQDQYEYITQHVGLKITEEAFNNVLEAYPKSRNS